MNDSIISGAQIVAGVDEVGRGSLVGPVVTAAVIIDPSITIPGIKDSKLLSKSQRLHLYQQIVSNYSYAIGEASAQEIDQYNILEATKIACARAVQNLPINPTKVLVDGNMKFKDTRFISIIRGDQTCYAIAAASIVAKVIRDTMMQELHVHYPVYGWNQNNGYGTRQHITAIKAYGHSVHHRTSFHIKQHNVI